jgi:hypothetical protein
LDLYLDSKLYSATFIIKLCSHLPDQALETAGRCRIGLSVSNSSQRCCRDCTTELSWTEDWGGQKRRICLERRVAGYDKLAFQQPSNGGHLHPGDGHRNTLLGGNSPYHRLSIANPLELTLDFRTMANYP